MSFNPKVSFLENVKHGLIANNKTLQDMVQDIDSTLPSIKTRLYQIKEKKASITPLDKEIVKYLEANCRGFKAWEKASKFEHKPLIKNER